MLSALPWPMPYERVGVCREAPLAAGCGPRGEPTTHVASPLALLNDTLKPCSARASATIAAKVDTLKLITAADLGAFVAEALGDCRVRLCQKRDHSSRYERQSKNTCRHCSFSSI